MAEQTKNMGNAAGGTQEKPGTTDVAGAQPKAAGLEQGRETAPNVQAQGEAADARRTTEQAYGASKQDGTTGKSNESKEDGAGDAERTSAQGQGNSKPGHDPVKPTGGTNSDSKR